MAVQYSSLRAALAAFIQAICERIANTPLPQVAVVVPRYMGGGMTQSESVAVTTGQSLVQAIASEWQLWAAYRDLEHAVEDEPDAIFIMTTDAVGNAAPPEFRRSAMNMSLAGFAADYFEQLDQLHPQWSESAFSPLWDNFASCLADHQAAVALLAPIYSAQSLDRDLSISLNQDLMIVQPSPRDRVRLAGWREWYFGMPPQFYVRRNVRLPIKGPHMAPLLEERRLAAAAVRLAVGGVAFTSDVATVVLPGSPRGFGSLGGRSGFPPQFAVGPFSEVTSGDASEVSRRFVQLSGLGPEYTPVLDRLESGMAKSDRDEQLIDLVSAMESILLAGTATATEVTYRFSLTGAWLLGDSPKARAAIFKQLNNLYGQRSHKVHGERATKEQTRRERDIPDPNGVALDLVRRLQQFVAELGVSWDQWVRYRQEAVFGLPSDGTRSSPAELS